MGYGGVATGEWDSLTQHVGVGLGHCGSVFQAAQKGGMR